VIPDRGQRERFLDFVRVAHEKTSKPAGR